MKIKTNYENMQFLLEIHAKMVNYLYCLETLMFSKLL